MERFSVAAKDYRPPGRAVAERRVRPQRVILRNMNRFYSPIGRIRRVDSLSTLLILRLNLFLATHRGKHYTPLFLPHPLRASAETKPDGWGGALLCFGFRLGRLPVLGTIFLEEPAGQRYNVAIDDRPTHLALPHRRKIW